MRKRIEITDKMVKGFAAEMTEKMNEGSMKKGCAIANYVLTAKTGKVTEKTGNNIYSMVSTTFKVCYPFSAMGNFNNRRFEMLVDDEGMIVNPHNVIVMAEDVIRSIEGNLDILKNGYWRDIHDECHPEFRETLEKYGIDWFEKRIAEFFAYLEGLAVSESCSVAGAEVADAPILSESEICPATDVEVEEQTEEDIINEVVSVINANLIDDATEGQKLDWSLFNDSTMEYLFANGGPELYEKIKNGVKSRRIVEVLAYDDCFYVWYDEENEVELEDMSEDYFKRREEQRKLAIELAEEDYEMKNYKERENYEEEDLKNYLANMLGRVYAHRCLKDDEEISIGDVVYMVKVFMEKLQELRGADLEYDALVLAKDKDMRVRAEFYEGFKTMESEIMIALLNAQLFDAKCVAEGLNRMYWDTIIWENDDVAVKYTSPCEDFERGCLLVVEKESECMLGGWIDVSSNQNAVEHVVEEIERYFWEVRIVTK